MNQMNKTVLVTGGFDPVHSGHLSYLRAARELGDTLIVAVNSDEWLSRKKGRAFMTQTERAAIIAEMRSVDRVIEITAQQDADSSACAVIQQVLEEYAHDTIVFANGGDRDATNIPEQRIQDARLEFVFGVGGDDKKNSSSWILEEWKAPRTERPWGYYRVLHTPNPNVKVKELTVNPGANLSMQRHKYRSEHWFIAEGIARVYGIDMASTDVEDLGQYIAHQSLHISHLQWHQLCNDSKVHPLKVIEIQYGDETLEEDIERMP